MQEVLASNAEKKSQKNYNYSYNFNTTVSIIKRKNRQKIIKMFKLEQYC